MVRHEEETTVPGIVADFLGALSHSVPESKMANAGTTVAVRTGRTRGALQRALCGPYGGLPKRSEVVVRIDPLDEQRGPANRAAGDALVTNAESTARQYESQCLHNVGWGFSGPGGDGGGEAHPEAVPAVA